MSLHWIVTETNDSSSAINGAMIGPACGKLQVYSAIPYSEQGDI